MIIKDSKTAEEKILFCLANMKSWVFFNSLSTRLVYNDFDECLLE